MPPMLSAPITYQLNILVGHPLRIAIGRFGQFLFPAGRYIYTGSAKRNIEARIARHLRKEKSLRWHIDYLLSANDVKVVSVKRCTEEECALNQRGRGVVVVPGFGASDCRKGCGSHLKYLGEKR